MQYPKYDTLPSSSAIQVILDTANSFVWEIQIYLVLAAHAFTSANEKYELTHK
jgi:hypothetical protein